MLNLWNPFFAGARCQVPGARLPGDRATGCVSTPQATSVSQLAGSTKALSRGAASTDHWREGRLPSCNPLVSLMTEIAKSNDAEGVSER
jgi:hypothetical protein